MVNSDCILILNCGMGDIEMAENKLSHIFETDVTQRV